MTKFPLLPARDPAGHKGTFGTVAVIGGSARASRMIGAPALAALGALRAGAGLVKLVMPEPILDAALTIEPSATGVALPTGSDGDIIAHEAAAVLDRVLADAEAVVIGPGMGVTEATKAAVVRVVQQEETPVVVDADAINALAEIPDLHLDFRAPAILTPHPGEFHRIAAALRIKADPRREGERTEAAGALAQRLGCIVVLKGAGTVVSDGQQQWVCDSRNPALATAGTGDVLSGVIASIVAQHAAPAGPIPRPGRVDLFTAACAGVEAHARAAEAWRDANATGGMLARELATGLPAAVDSLRAKGT